MVVGRREFKTFERYQSSLWTPNQSMLSFESRASRPLGVAASGPTRSLSEPNRGREKGDSLFLPGMSNQCKVSVLQSIWTDCACLDRQQRESR